MFIRRQVRKDTWVCILGPKKARTLLCHLFHIRVTKPHESKVQASAINSDFLHDYKSQSVKEKNTGISAFLVP